jgi:hypothetical protein
VPVVAPGPIDHLHRWRTAPCAEQGRCLSSPLKVSGRPRLGNPHCSSLSLRATVGTGLLVFEVTDR